MKPAKMLQEFAEPKRIIMNGPRPSPLSINKASHLIQKPSSSSCLTNVPSHAAAARQQNPKSNAQNRQPVIIYTHSPKIIHTQARDFRALVQKLTGLSRSEDEITPAESSGDKNHVKNNTSVHDNDQSTSVVTDEKCGGAPEDFKESSSFIVSPLCKSPNANFADFPLFTPNSSNFFRYPDAVFLSPSFVEFMKGLPEY